MSFKTSPKSAENDPIENENALLTMPKKPATGSVSYTHLRAHET